MRSVALVLFLLMAACTQDVAGTGGAGVAGGGVGAASGGGSTAGGGPAGQATPTPRVSSPASINDPSGMWVLHDGANQGKGPVSSCARDQIQTMTLYYTGDELSGTVDTCAADGNCHKLEALDGAYGQGEAQLVGQFTGNLDPTNPTTVTYVLKFDVATQHLVGTRNGAAVWAAPFVPSDDPACRPSPTPEPVPTLQEGTIIPIGQF